MCTCREEFVCSLLGACLMNELIGLSQSPMSEFICCPEDARRHWLKRVSGIDEWVSAGAFVLNGYVFKLFFFYFDEGARP